MQERHILFKTLSTLLLGPAITRGGTKEKKKKLLPTASMEVPPVGLSPCIILLGIIAEHVLQTAVIIPRPHSRSWSTFSSLALATTTAIKLFKGARSYF